MRSNFSGHHRKNLLRQVSRFREASAEPVRMVKFTRTEDVNRFLTSAVEISKKTYQWNLHGRGLSATEKIGRRYCFAAQNGWFRSYILFCGDVPVSFIAGYKWRGRYYTDEIGYDPAWSAQSPGSVLTVMALEDLFAENTPDLIDFGSYDKYKEFFSNDGYSHSDVMLFRRTLYCRLAQTAHYACRVATRAAVRCLSAFNVKSKLKRAIRNRSVKSQANPDGSR